MRALAISADTSFLSLSITKYTTFQVTIVLGYYEKNCPEVKKNVRLDYQPLFGKRVRAQFPKSQPFLRERIEDRTRENGGNRS